MNVKTGKGCFEFHRQAYVCLMWVVVAGLVLCRVDAASTAPAKHRTISDADRAFWSFRPVANVQPPTVRDAGWCRNEIDRFILAKLEEQGLTPAPPADRPTLIRRANFDLTGLPPTPLEVDAFVRDASPDAYEKLVDRLLASPRYGERWARHWLDLVRYAESDGFKQDAYRPNAWPYRDYVIRSFNEDKPYDRFVCEQLAGDELWPDDPDARIATGYMRCGLYEYNNRDVPKQWTQMLTDVTDVTGDVFLGLSMGCARCHDHKFDPILQADYFRLQSFFAPMLPRNDLPIATVQQRDAFAKAQAEWESKTASIRARMMPIEEAGIAGVAKSAISKFPEEMQAMIRKPAPDRTPLESQLAQLALRQVIDQSENPQPKIRPADKARYSELKKQLEAFDAIKPAPLPHGIMMTDVGPIAPPVTIPGHADEPPVEPGVPVVLRNLPGGQLTITPSATSTGRRTALAKWITNPGNPLASRVIVNRIWQFHFGRGLVATSSDFGHLGTPPSHPELLDWLAHRFIEQGWSFKQLHRQIMLSATYCQAALRPAPEIARTKDPEDRWLWRMNTRRLDAEQIRDSMLAASGELQLEGSGAPVETSSPRRAVYTKAVRNTRDPVLDAFDVADSFGSVCLRNVTTTPTQSLLMINGDWPLKRAAAFATRVRSEASSADVGAAVDVAYQLAYSRPPRSDEKQAAIAFLAKASASPKDVSTASGSAQSDSGSFELPVTQSMPQRDGQAILIHNATPGDMLSLATPAPLVAGDMTAEAYVQLESYYPDGKVRVIVSSWDGKHEHAGWALGVTSDKSKFTPHTLILQLATPAGFEVIASDLHLELHKPYYVAASLSADDPTVTFHLKDISDMDAPLKSATVHRTMAGLFASEAPFVIGGRSSSTGGSVQGWDGLIDEVRISKAALKVEQLVYSGGDARGSVVGYWQFEEHPGLLRDTAGLQKDLKPLVARPSTGHRVPTAAGLSNEALTDFCHVLLNSNEFLYVD